MSYLFFSDRFEYIGEEPFDNSPSGATEDIPDLKATPTGSTVNESLLLSDAVQLYRITSSNPNIFTDTFVIKFHKLSNTLDIGTTGNMLTGLSATTTSSYTLPDNTTQVYIICFDPDAAHLQDADKGYTITPNMFFWRLQNQEYFDGATYYFKTIIYPNVASDTSYEVWFVDDPVTSELTGCDIYNYANYNGLNSKSIPDIYTEPSGAVWSKPLNQAQASSETISDAGDLSIFFRCTFAANATGNGFGGYYSFRMAIRENSITYTFYLFYKILAGYRKAVFLGSYKIDDTIKIGTTKLATMLTEYYEKEGDPNNYRVTDLSSSIDILGINITLSKYSNQSSISVVYNGRIVDSLETADNFRENYDILNDIYINNTYIKGYYFDNLTLLWTFNDVNFGYRGDYLNIPTDAINITYEHTSHSELTTLEASFTTVNNNDPVNHGEIILVSIEDPNTPRSWVVEPTDNKKDPMLPNDIILINGEEITIEKVTYKYDINNNLYAYIIEDV